MVVLGERCAGGDDGLVSTVHTNVGYLAYRSASPRIRDNVTRYDCVDLVYRTVELTVNH